MSGSPKAMTLEELDRILERDPGYVNALLTLYVESQDEVKRLQAELQAYKDKERFYAEDDLEATCLECGELMEHVRPGKWQCNRCEAGGLGDEPVSDGDGEHEAEPGAERG